MDTWGRAMGLLGLGPSDGQEQRLSSPWLTFVLLASVFTCLMTARTAVDADGAWPVIWRALLAAALGLGAVATTTEAVGRLLARRQRPPA